MYMHMKMYVCMYLCMHIYILTYINVYTNNIYALSLSRSPFRKSTFPYPHTTLQFVTLSYVIHEHSSICAVCCSVCCSTLYPHTS